MSFIKFGSLSIHDHGDDASVKVWAAVPHDIRREVAQALAGDEYVVMPLDEALTVTQSRMSMDALARAGVTPPDVIDPADVKVGDVVEVEADDGSWLVRGEVLSANPGAAYPLLITAPHLGGKSIRPGLRDATVRLVRRAEPEPDPEQVELWADALSVVWSIGEVSTTDREVAANLIRELRRRGVTVERED